MDSSHMQVVEFGRLTMRDWAELVEGDDEPFGATCAGFEFRPKDHHVGIRDPNGTLLAAGGWSRVELEVDGHGRFDVIGVGALIVRREHRGSGLATPVMARLRELVEATGAELCLLLCEPHLEPLYARRGYRSVADRVWVRQPSGPVRWPLPAMWRPVAPAARWPAGPVRIHGLPF
ncbi:MAG: GNAT family N-acetyltransferase [Solirubrobacteraceae bacterium]